MNKVYIVIYEIASVTAVWTHKTREGAEQRIINVTEEDTGSRWDDWENAAAHWCDKFDGSVNI